MERTAGRKQFSNTLWEREVIGQMEGGEANDRFSSYWNPETDMTYPLILAKIPWEIFAYLPFGGWNECPGASELMAAVKYWFEQYGFCPDLDQGEEGSSGVLADVLWQSDIWYFWWD